MHKLILPVAVLATLTATAAAQFSHTVPNGLATTEGNSSNAFPWNRFSTTPLRTQLIYDSVNFTAASINFPILISRLQWRANATTASWTGGTLSNCIVEMSTAAVDYAAPTTVFNNNHGLDRATVFSGNATFIAGTGNGTGVPGPTVIDLAITPFLYDPTLGDLLIDCQVPGGSTGGGTQLDVQTSAPNATRVYDSTNTGNGTIGLNHGVVVTIDYVPATGLYPAFSATPTSGASPLLVQFTDQSFTSDPGGVLAWQWDFDGDTVIDSTLQNPSFTYTSCGDFNVSLTAVDGTHGAVTTTRNGFITVDPLTADFTATPTGGGNLPLLVQFTDASTNATGWSWDFDNDTVVDSTLQNPVWAYTTPGTYTVSLAVTNACRSDSVTKPDMILVGGIVVPAADQAVDGNSSNAYPFDTGALRMQNILDSSHFTGQGVISPIIISKIKLRANATTTTWTGSSINNLQVDLSTCPVDFSVASSTFASNHGADLTTVYNAPLVIPAGSSTAGVPGPFHVDIPLSPPFVYDPSLGDLTIDYISSGVVSTAGTPTLDAETTTGVALAKRIYSTTNTSPTGTLTSGEHVNVLEIDFAPALGLFTEFAATPTTGASPLLVQFTDQSYSSDPGGVVAWQWDFDGDSVIDSTLQNPSFTYTGCGSYSVSLTATDATHGPVTLTKPNYIVTDDLVVSFTKQDMGGGVFNFTDTSVPTPQTWAWDFDGDNVIDSTLQNPTFTYSANCSVNVITLTATLNCRTGVATDSAFVAPANLTAAPFAGGNGTGGAAAGNMFDISVTAPDGISVCALTVATYSFTGPFTVDVYVTPDTYVGKDANIAAWRLVASGSGVANGGGTTTPSIQDIVLNSPFYLPAGNYGFIAYYIPVSGSAYVAYTNGPLGPYTNADLTLYPNPTAAPGLGKYNLFGSGANSPRIWNGTIHYTTTSRTNTGGYGFFGEGCPSSLGISNLTAAAAPVLGQTLAVTANNLPLNVAVGLIGFSNTGSVFGPLPLDLSVVGAPGCFARVSTDAQILLLGASNSVTWNLAIPNLPTLLAAQAYQQLFVLDAAANGLGAVTSDAAGFVIGQ